LGTWLDETAAAGCLTMDVMLQINASIAKHQGRIWCVYRTKNLYQYDAECFLAELNADLEPISNRSVFAENKNTAFEDVRLFSFGNKLLAFYTYMPFDGSGGWNWEYIVGFAEFDVDTCTLKDHVSLRDLSRRFNEKNFSNEKNWSPYVYKDELYMVTDFDPFLRIIKIGAAGEKPQPEEVFFSTERTAGWQFGELRGGTPLLVDSNSDDGWLYGFIHSYRTNEKGYARYYYYTVVRFNHLRKAFEYFPQPFTYPDEKPNEEYKLLWNYSNKRTLKVIFPIGIMHYKDGVVVSFGKDDVYSFTEYFSWKRIKAYFKKDTE
jgi:hypothetical protein